MGLGVCKDSWSNQTRRSSAVSERQLCGTQPLLIHSSIASSTALCISPLWSPYLLKTCSRNRFSKFSEIVMFMRTVLDFLLIPYTYAPILLNTYLCIDRYVHKYEHRQRPQNEGFGDSCTSWNDRPCELEDLPSEITKRERLVSGIQAGR